MDESELGVEIMNYSKASFHVFCNCKSIYNNQQSLKEWWNL